MLKQHKSIIETELQKTKVEHAIFIMFLTVAILLLAAVFFAPRVEASNLYNIENHEKEVSDYITWFFRASSPRKWKRAIDIAPVIVRESVKQDFDPLLISVIIAKESGFKPGVVSTDGHNTIGLMQVKPCGVCGKGYNLGTIDGQIQAGVMCLKMSRENCNGTLEQTLTMYASGRCVSRSARTHRLIERRIELYNEAVENFRINADSDS